MITLIQDYVGLAVVSAIVLVASLVLAAVGLQMHAARQSLRPLVFMGVLFAIALVPQLLVHGAAAQAQALQAVLAEAAIGGSGTFSQPVAVFGPGAEAAQLRDARPVFVGALSGAEVAQLWIRDSGETGVAARFADEDGARAGAAALWAMFSPHATSGDGVTSYGNRAVGDVIGLRRVRRAVFAWTGPDRASVEGSLQRASVVVAPADTRPQWLMAFDDWRLAAGATALLAMLACVWFLKGAAWAARMEPATAQPVSAAELEKRLAALRLTRLGDGRWEWVAGYEQAWESGAYRYVLELDAPHHRVKVLEYLASRTTDGDGRHWRLQRGMTFFRKELEADWQKANAPLIRAVTAAGWSWQPLAFDAPPALAWLTR